MRDSVRSFRASSVKEALARVSREMGTDAEVLQTKRVRRTGLFSIFGSGSQYEVTAREVDRRKVSRTAVETKSAYSSKRPSTAGTIAANFAQRRSGSIQEPVLDQGIGEHQNLTDLSDAEIQVQTQPSAKIGSLESSLCRNVGIQFAAPSSSSAIEERLDSLHQMVLNLGQQPRPYGTSEMPHELFGHYLTLIENDVEDDIARDLIGKLQRYSVPGQFENPASASALLNAVVEREIRCIDPILSKRGHRQVAMMVGPTGVGKTTTIAKLAGRLSRNEGLRVGLITIDTYRVAAIDQLQAYADIMKLPLKVVSSPMELTESLTAFSAFDLVLIDTAGRSPRDEGRLGELKQIVDAANPDHVFLTLSLASGAKSLRNSIERFSFASPTSLIMTKLDESTGCGAFLSASRTTSLPFAFTTAGQEVPRDIEPATPGRIARHVVDPENVRSSFKMTESLS